MPKRGGDVGSGGDEDGDEVDLLVDGVCNHSSNRAHQESDAFSNRYHRMTNHAQSEADKSLSQVEMHNSIQMKDQG
jgi:hypothetical protein